MNEKEPKVNWFFVHDGKPQGAGYFVGYERESNRRVGYIGLSGFRSEPLPTEEWIPVRGELITDYSHWSSAPYPNYLSGAVWEVRIERGDLPPRLVYVPSGNHLRLVDLAARTVTTVFESSEPIESVGIPTLSSWTVGRRHEGAAHSGADKTSDPCIGSQTQGHQVFTIPTEVDQPEPGELVRDRRWPGDR